MGKRTTLVVGIALIVIGAIGMTMTLASQPTYTGAWPASMRGGMDAMFIRQMIPHHDEAIAMADLALTRAEHPELKQLAQNIKRTQTAENAQMRAWYRQWFGAEVPTTSGGAFGMMGGMMGRGATDLDALSEADSFDKAFIEAMIPHHQMGVMMSGMAGSATSRPEMRDFTQAISDAQSREIEQMEEWYGQWFGR